MPRDQRLYMTFPIDFWTHPKVSRLSDAAFRAFVEANGHSRMRETDGHIEAEDVEFHWSAEALDELVKSHPTRPLMVRDGDDYQLRDYAEHQWTKADRDLLHEKRSKAGRASASKRSTHVEHVSTEIGIEIEKEITTTSSNKVVATATPRKRGHRIPDTFVVTAKMRSWANGELPGLDVDAATRTFVDYWRAESGAKASKLDWVSAWRVWLRRDWKPSRSAPAKQTPEERMRATIALGNTQGAIES